MQNMEMTVELVTPERAAQFLTANNANRKVRPGWVRILSARIRRGEWTCSHQGVAFDPRGNLLDGQHRLLAIVDAGIPCKMAVFRNADPESFRVLDQGARRSMADMAGIDKRVIEPCALAAILLYGSKYSYDQLETVLDSYVLDVSSNLIDYCGRTSRFYSSSPMKLACVISAMLHGEEYPFEIYRALVSLDFKAMPPVAQTLVRQEQQGRLRTTGSGNSRGDILRRGFVVFDPRRAQQTRLTSTPEQALEAVTYARDFLRNDIIRLSGN